MVNNFTSTSKFDKYFSTAILMNTFKKYFNYTRVGAACGIQSIHMAGVCKIGNCCKRN